MGFTNADDLDWEYINRGKILPLGIEESIVTSRNPKDDHPVWDYLPFDFLSEPEMEAPRGRGLFTVNGNIHQVRNLDLSNMTIVEVGGAGEVVVIDPLASVETASAALGMYTRNKKDYNPDIQVKVKAIIYTHSDVSQFGGVEAIFAHAVNQDIPIYAPQGFLEHAVAENILAGNAMSRRSVYMYGQSLKIDFQGQVGCGIGMGLSKGIWSLIAPMHEVSKNGPLDPPIPGLNIACQLTPGTDGNEMNLYFPETKALYLSKSATHAQQNVQTLQGGPVRDARLWSRYLEETLSMLGDKAVVVFASHHWPTWIRGDSNPIVPFLSQQRDFYAYIHNETVRHLNNGLGPVEIAELIEMPPSLREVRALQGCYGSIIHNVKAIYDKYMGWYDGNPANLWKHPRREESGRYVKCMGGIDNVIELAKGYHEEQDVRFAITLLNHVLFSDPDNKPAREELATIYRKLGYGSENATWRYIYLTGAKELVGDDNLSGDKEPEGKVQVSLRQMRDESFLALNLDQLFDTMAVRVDGPKAWEAAFTANFIVQYQNGGVKGWHMRLRNAALTGLTGRVFDSTSSSPPEADLTVTLTHSQLAKIVATPNSTLDGLETTGDATVWDNLQALLTTPNKAFTIVTPPEALSA